MYALVNPFLQIALLRMRPQDLPWSPFLMYLALAAHWLMGAVMYSFRLPVLAAAMAALVGTLVLCMLTVSLLYVNRLQSRAVQTLTSLAGAEVIVGVVMLPVAAWLHGLEARSAATGLPGLLQLLLLAWSLTVSGHVLRHALDAPFPLGIVIALVFFVIAVSVITTLFPGIA